MSMMVMQSKLSRGPSRGQVRYEVDCDPTQGIAPGTLTSMANQPMPQVLTIPSGRGHRMQKQNQLTRVMMKEQHSDDSQSPPSRSAMIQASQKSGEMQTMSSKPHLTSTTKQVHQSTMNITNAGANQGDGVTTSKKSYKSFRIGARASGPNIQMFEEKTIGGFVMRGMKPHQSHNMSGNVGQIKIVGINQESTQQDEYQYNNSLGRSSSGGGSQPNLNSKRQHYLKPDQLNQKTPVDVTPSQSLRISPSAKHNDDNRDGQVVIGDNQGSNNKNHQKMFDNQPYQSHWEDEPNVVISEGDTGNNWNTVDGGSLPSPRMLKHMFQQDRQLLNAYVHDVQQLASRYIERPIEVFNRLQKQQHQYLQQGHFQNMKNLKKWRQTQSSNTIGRQHQFNVGNKNKTIVSQFRNKGGRPMTHGVEASQMSTGPTKFSDQHKSIGIYDTSKIRKLKVLSKQDQEMNSIVKKYMDTCDQGQKLNIKQYLKDVCITNKSYFYPDDFMANMDPKSQDGLSHARRSSYVGSEHSEGARNSSNPRDSVYEGQSSMGGSALTKKQSKKEQLKQQQLEEKERQLELQRLEKQVMKKAYYLVENYQNKHYEPEKFMNYRNNRGKQLEKQFIKEYIKKKNKLNANLNLQNVAQQHDPDASQNDQKKQEDDCSQNVYSESNFNYNDDTLQHSLLQKQSRFISNLDNTNSKNQQMISQIYKTAVDVQLKQKGVSHKMNQRSKVLLGAMNNLSALAQTGVNNYKYDSGPDDIDPNEENEQLEKLLKQTEGMNAVISAGQYKMHKKDINDRLHSLAFKMEKVYNLDKKKGPAADVYKYFKSTIEDDGMT